MYVCSKEVQVRRRPGGGRMVWGGGWEGGAGLRRARGWKRSGKGEERGLGMGVGR